MTAAQSDLQAAFESSPFHRLIKGHLEPTETGVVLTAVLDEAFSTSLGRAHGGVVASLLDTAATWALVAKTGRVWVTADLRVDYLRPVSLGVVRVEGTVVRTGSRLGNATATVWAGDRQAATGVGVFLPLDRS